MPDVRCHITALIHQWAAQTPRCIIEGRDIGTAVFPAAPSSSTRPRRCRCHRACQRGLGLGARCRGGRVAVERSERPTGLVGVGVERSTRSVGVALLLRLRHLGIDALELGL
ncbi:hypothetical protein BS330_29005 [Amycolatopsis keratiniphila subsp. nogabecina]|nr:hypothetical protein BS330_29005 [Amycolatopsis keratiniphila subsp. nogabecina]